MPDHLKGLLITAAGVLLIVPDSLLIRLIGADALTIAFWRSILPATLIALGVLAVEGPEGFRRLTRLGPWVLVYIVLMGFTGVFFVVAVSLTTVANVVFLIAAMPVFAALMSRVFLGERLSRRMVLTIAVVALGIGVIAYGSGDAGNAQASLKGDLVALLIPITFGAALTIARRMRASSLVPAIPPAFFAVGLVLLPFAEPLSIPAEDWWLVGLHGLLVAGALAFISVGPRYLPSAEVALMMLLESVLAPLLVWAVLGESPGRWAILGGALVVGALALSNAIALRRARRLGGRGIASSPSAGGDIP